MLRLMQDIRTRCKRLLKSALDKDRLVIQTVTEDNMLALEYLENYLVK